MAASTKQRLDKHEERLNTHDRQVKAIRDLIHEGMRLMTETRKDLRIIASMQKRNEEMQNRTEAKLQALIDSLRRGGNGHARRRLAL